MEYICFPYLMVSCFCSFNYNRVVSVTYESSSLRKSFKIPFMVRLNLKIIFSDTFHTLYQWCAQAALTDPHIENVCTEECHCSWKAVFGHCGFSCSPILIPVFWHLWLVLTNCGDTVSLASRLLPSCWCYANHFPLSQALSLSEFGGFVLNGMRLSFSHLM